MISTRCWNIFREACTCVNSIHKSIKALLLFSKQASLKLNKTAVLTRESSPRFIYVCCNFVRHNFFYPELNKISDFVPIRPLLSVTLGIKVSVQPCFIHCKKTAKKFPWIWPVKLIGLSNHELSLKDKWG